MEKMRIQNSNKAIRYKFQTFIINMIIREQKHFFFLKNPKLKLVLNNLGKNITWQLFRQLW